MELKIQQNILINYKFR